MNIKQFSEISGLSAHTLRYYEKIGLLHPDRNTSNNHRDYHEKDLEWVRFIKRLKGTNMPLKEIKAYARLREMGGHTAEDRLKLLEKHQECVHEDIEKLLHNRDMIHQKVDWYKSLLKIS